MTSEEFKKVVEKQLELCKTILDRKTTEYVHDNNDRFEAFKHKWLYNVNAVCPSKKILWYQMAKHIQSLYDICQIDDIKYDIKNRDLILEKITDTINYLIILRGIIDDRCKIKDGE